jgi:threonylcarbamoyladenosine tRNA methylthiotransferase MtaB
MVGSEQTILVENNGFAHTDNFTLVAAPSLEPRTLARVAITGHNGKHLTMELLAANAA